MTIIVLLLLVLALILLAVWSQVKINKDTTDVLDELDMEVDMMTTKTADLEHRVMVLERKIVSMEGEKDADNDTR